LGSIHGGTAANIVAGEVVIQGTLRTLDRGLRARLLEDKKREEEAKYSATRKSQIGSGGREEKIRTYNFPQNRITDHRIGLTLYNLDRVMEGDLNEMISALQHADLEQRLKDSALA